MKILVTGGGGFLGTWIIRELMRNPTHLVTNFSRRPYAHLEDIGVPTIRGSVDNREDVERALALGFDAIIHTAAKVGMWGSRNDFEATNVQGTKLLLELAQRHGVKRFVYTSTPSVVFGRGGHEGLNETTAYPTKHLGEYARSKAIAEQAVLAANSPAFTTVSLRPHLVWGPGDQNLIPRVLDRARLGKLKVVGDGENQVDVVYVENAAHAHVLALTADAKVVGGQAYFIGQGPVKLWDFINEVLKRANIPAPDDSISVKAAYAIGWMLEKLWALAGIQNPEPPMTRFVALNLGSSHWYDHTKAKSDLGWEPKISIHDGLTRLFEKREENRRLIKGLPPLPPV